MVEFEVSQLTVKKYIQRRSNVKMSNATVSDIRFYPDREIDKVMTAKLASCDYIHDHLNIIVIGATGAGKTFTSLPWAMKHTRKQSMLDI